MSTFVQVQGGTGTCSNHLIFDFIGTVRKGVQRPTRVHGHVVAGGLSINGFDQGDDST